MTGFAPVPVAAGDVMQLNASAAGQGGHAFAAGVVNGTLLAVGFTVTRLAPWITVSSADGSGSLARSYSFTSPPLYVDGVVPPNATLVSYAVFTDIRTGNLRSAVASVNAVPGWPQRRAVVDGRRPPPPSATRGPRQSAARSPPCTRAWGQAGCTPPA